MPLPRHALQAVCRHWKAAAEDEELWKVRFARRFGLGKVTGRAASKKFYADKMKKLKAFEAAKAK